MYGNDLFDNTINLKSAKKSTLWRNQWKESTQEKTESAIGALCYCTDVLLYVKLSLQ